MNSVEYIKWYVTKKNDLKLTNLHIGGHFERYLELKRVKYSSKLSRSILAGFTDHETG